MDYVEIVDDAILPDNFDPNSDTYDVEQEAPATAEALTTEPVAEAPAAAQESVAEPTTAPEATPEVKPQTIRVKFNHEERELSYDEAAAYAQKGMNYDKMSERLSEYERQDEEAKLLATRLGYDSVPEMHKAAAQNLRNRKIRELVEAGNTQAMAEFLVNQEFGQAPTQAKQEPQKPAPQTQEQPTPQPAKPAIDTDRMAQLDEFVKAYPGVTKLPEEVINANKSGTRLLVAYERYLHKQDSNELAILRQNQAAAAKAPVTGVTGKASVQTKDEADDPFLKGFDHDGY